MYIIVALNVTKITTFKLNDLINLYSTRDIVLVCR